MTLALLAMSHSPLLEHAELDAEVSGRARGRLRRRPAGSSTTTTPT